MLEPAWEMLELTKNGTPYYGNLEYINWASDDNSASPALAREQEETGTPEALGKNHNALEENPSAPNNLAECWETWRNLVKPDKTWQNMAKPGRMPQDPRQGA